MPVHIRTGLISDKAKRGRDRPTSLAFCFERFKFVDGNFRWVPTPNGAAPLGAANINTMHLT